MNVINQSDLRDINTGLIMRMLLEQAPISRRDLARRSGLAPSTVTSIVAGLQQDHFIRECGWATSKSGRRPILLEIDSTGGYFIGVELNSPTSKIGVLDLATTLVHSSSYRTAAADVDSCFRQLVERIQEMLQWCRAGNKSVLGIGIGATGLIDSATGNVIESTNLGWDDVPLLTRLKGVFSLPVTLENEANAAALGESVRGGQEAPMKNMMYVAVGEGIGCGITINGALHTGAHGIAGEIGHITVAPSGALCRCGKHGCLEVVASGAAMYDRYVQEDGPADLSSFAGLIDLAKEGDPIAQRVLNESGSLIGTAIGNLINVLDLDTVILGGELLLAESVLSSEIRRAAFAAMLPPARRGVDIRLSGMKMHSAVVGAAILSWKQIFA